MAGHAGKVIMVRGAPDLDRVQSSVAARLPRAPLLCMRLAERDGDPWWVPDPQIDVRARVGRRARRPSTGLPGCRPSGRHRSRGL